MVRAALTMRVWIVLATACLAVQYADSRILFPEEIPTLAALVYSILPPVKIGQDSRFGLGFKLGRNADAQVLVELGPQQATEPLGNESKKREVPRKVLTQAEREMLRRIFMDRIKSRELFTESISQRNISMANSSDDNKQMLRT